MERVADANAEKAHTRFIVSDDPAEVVERIGTYLDLGFEDLLLHAPGNDQRRFLEQFSEDVMPALRARAERRRPRGPRRGRCRAGGRPRRPRTRTRRGR